VCDFDEGPDFYFNAGPGRIPQSHGAILYYCKKLNIKLQPCIFACRSDLLQNDNFNHGRATPLGRIKPDRLPAEARCRAECGAYYRNQAENSNYQEITRPQGRLILAGDYLSFLSGWMEGAILSAELAVKRIEAESHD
jgi:hypothetical protein